LESGEIFNVTDNYPSLKSILKPIPIFNQIQLYQRLINHPENFILQREILPESPETKILPASLIVQSDQQVIVTAYENGPRKFFVRFVSNFHNKFEDFQKQINAAMLIPLSTDPTIGSLYLIEGNTTEANVSDTKGENIRVVVTEIRHDLVLVKAIDFGWDRIINKSNLYEMSNVFKDTPAFASPFSLEGIDSVTHLNDDELKFYFQYMTKNRRLQIEVSQSKGEL
jgi:hypothetical protein